MIWTKQRKKSHARKGRQRRKGGRDVGRHDRYLDLLRTRMMVVMALIVMGFSAIGVRMVYVGSVPVDEPVSRLLYLAKEAPVRGNIYDRDGVLLATTLKVHSVYADPKRMLDVSQALMRLKDVLPDVDMDKLASRLENRKRRFVWVARQLTPEQVKSVNDLGVPGIGFKEEFARIYPHNRLFSHVLGGVDTDGQGLAGIEASYNEHLNQGEDVYLTVNVRMQEQLRAALLENIDRTDAKGSWGVVTDPNTSDVLAMVSLPDYDPNRLGETKPEAWMNRVVKGSYEMGSVFKILTMAQGIDQGYVTRDTMLDCTKPIRIGRFTIRDSHPRYKMMPLYEAFQRSSNVGASRVADMFGAEEQQDFIRNLRLLEPVETGLYEVGRPQLPRRWKRTQTMTISFGHGLAVTPIHMAAAVGALVSDGQYRSPNLVKGRETEAPYRVIAENTVGEVRRLMHDVVEKGTGRNARISGYALGGKTGTSEKQVAGKYSEDKNLASFVGILPAHEPKYLALVMVDEGKKDLNSGGTAAAPAFKMLAERVIPVVGLSPEVNPFKMSDFDVMKAQHASF